MVREGEAAIHRETKGNKLMMACCTLSSSLISVPFCIFYLYLWQQAIDFNDQESDWKGDGEPYDRCTIKDSTEAPLNTNWTLVFAYNSFLYMGLSLMSLLIWLGIWSWPLRIFGTVSGFIAGIAHLGGVILTGIMRYSSDGKACADRDIAYTYDD